jgi:hypothetical protein
VAANLPTWLTLLLVVLATPRATRLVTRDKLPLIAVPRDAFVRRWGVYDDVITKSEERKIAIGGKKTNVVMSSLAYLWECDWCVSIWLGAGLTYLTWLWPETMTYVLVGLIASYAAGWNANAESKAK